MILYFSSTGNCKHVAERVAEALGDRAESVLTSGDSIQLKKGEYFGIITPTYFVELPTIIREFLNRLTIEAEGDNYVFVIATYGTTPGCTGTDAKKLLKSKGVAMNGAFSVKMPDNWTVWFDLSDPEKVAGQNEKAELEMDRVIERIRNKEQGNHMSLRLPYFVRFFSDIAFGFARKTKNLHLEDGCIGCGLCASKCPVKAIEMRDGKPVWVKERCALCLGCLHHCPKFAIQYGGGATRKHGQYRNPHTKI